ncbi:hypothetical protein SAMN04487895_11395 [Paenibacillus sophorae]|uniref:Uncharacterized protein n=1 Tax=Paenibacillus sophorae TaxID=1333845 RepID=A0A1H8T8C1_9BACL|nr:hypothetical protein [Paenibacillus sophorae]QWU17139.1 hypothetical protein KP014_08205 [Paenibacillus sophorae]SEO87065.1 hypothetical protein SAMN04487895_11395 [Paenibacillus sophorae]
MEWHTFGQMLMNIRVGQKASTPDGRTLVRTPEGLCWSGGRRDGVLVEIRGYLFSDLWRIFEDEESSVWAAGREEAEALEREMLENQYEELLSAFREERRHGKEPYKWTKSNSD